MKIRMMNKENEAEFKSSSESPEQKIKIEMFLSRVEYFNPYSSETLIKEVKKISQSAA